MADLAENLRTFLLADATIAATIGTRCHQGMVPQADIATLPYVWFARSRRQLDRTLDAAAGDPADEQWFDVECISDDLDESQDLAEAVEDRLNNYRGTLGTQSVQGIFLDDQDDNYVPRGTMGETELHVAALAVQIYL